MRLPNLDQAIVDDQRPAARDGLSLEGDGDMIKELDLVVLKRHLPESRLKAGDVGTVVLEHSGGEGFEVEFMTLTGETVAVITVPSDAVRAVHDGEIAHVRRIA